MRQEYYISLIERFRHYDNESEWLEFKVSNDKPTMIGEYISVLGNSALFVIKKKLIYYEELIMKLMR